MTNQKSNKLLESILFLKEDKIPQNTKVSTKAQEIIKKHQKLFDRLKSA
jgi:hypothetical protein